MVIQSSGYINLSNVQTEFGGTNPISFSEYYAGAGHVQSGASGINGAIPSSGALALSKFYGSRAFDPVTHSFLSPGDFSETIPTGATQLIIGLFAAGAGGATGGPGADGIGGGGGSYCAKTYTLTAADWGKIVSVHVPLGGNGSVDPDGNFGEDGDDATASGVTLNSVVVNITAGGGKAVGSGGIASGGDTLTSGGNNSGSTGGIAANSGPGSGGNGGLSGANGHHGNDGKALFSYT